LVDERLLLGAFKVTMHIELLAGNLKAKLKEYKDTKEQTPCQFNSYMIVCTLYLQVYLALAA
jgi:hypothetical protein